ncbi:MAG TPA: cupin domain-containing protein [Hyphomicrobiaceae bacterium]|nr:cupin domain-containing protein [Hyphomicrobiaceae bacterium]
MQPPIKRSPGAANLFEPDPRARSGEISSPVLKGQGFRMEHITSFGQATPEGCWYDQAEAEWVIVLSGRARLRFEAETEDRALGAGDAIFLPAGCRHRVAWTDPDQPTIWLALYIDTELLPALPCS